MALPPVIYPVTASQKVKWWDAYPWDLYDVFFETGEQLIDNAEWRRFVLEFTRATPVGTTEDKAQFGFDCVNLTGGGWDNTWTTADHDTVNTHITTFYTAIKSFIGTEFSNTGRKAYRRRFQNPMTLADRFVDSGPPTWQYLTPVPGTNASNSLPYQVALSLTLKTAMPRHWGRMYIPGLTESSSTLYGRWDSGVCAAFNTALGVFLNGMWDAQFPVVVASTQIDNVLGGNLMTVVSGQVDDIPDVIRRRRPRNPAIRSQSPIT